MLASMLRVLTRRGRRTSMSTMAALKLPRLPVPDLPKTLAKYMESIQPVLLQDELDGGPPFTEALKKHEDIMRSFLNGPGQVAQRRLLALDKVSPHNWLDDNFWLKKVYLEWRAPLLINSNWWLTFVNDADVPKEIITDQGQGFTPWQIRRAACLVHGILDFKHRMQSCVASCIPGSFLTRLQTGNIPRYHPCRCVHRHVSFRELTSYRTLAEALYLCHL